tara:strand:- start:111 stop:920 length:810 start_codon:yes stop_codon:yes gene_type:complete
MKKFLTTFALYSDHRQTLYEQFIRPRFAKYAEMHGMKFVELNNDNFKIQILHPEFDVRENMHFNRWLLFKRLLNEGKLNDGDILYNFDADVFIKEMNQHFEPEKGFSYAIDSGNTHCFGFFALKINEFSRRLIDAIIDRERWLKVSQYEFFNEHNNTKGKWHLADQQTYYTCAGIKPHSWESFYDLDNLGFHSYPTEYTIFSLDELKENVNVLPTEWNVTQLYDETGDHKTGKPNTYDINQTTLDKTIFRHFAGGQPWRFDEYTQKYPI